MHITRMACAGASCAYLLRKLGKRAGSYAPGLVDRLLFELGTEQQGADLGRVARWFSGRTAELSRMGNRYGARLVAFKTPTILDWVKAGQGHRGAVMVTSGETLHPGAGISAPHAVALIWEPGKKAGQAGLVAVDPWPGMGKLAPLPDNLEAAHRRCLNRAFLLYSYGWS